jgi:hypothetical protein
VVKDNSQLVRFPVSTGFWFSLYKLFPHARLRRNIRGFGNQPETGNRPPLVIPATSFSFASIFNRALWYCRIGVTSHLQRCSGFFH